MNEVETAAADGAAIQTGQANSVSSEARAAQAQTQDQSRDLGETVVPITSLKVSACLKLGDTGKVRPEIGLGATFGTGFCLDAACRFIATNYHVAVAARIEKIQGQKVVQRYCATGPTDEAATANFIPNAGVFAFTSKRDLALFELQRPLPHHHGLPFSLDELQTGEGYEIFGYPKGAAGAELRLTRFQVRFKAATTSGLLAFEFRSPEEAERVAGVSGGIVLDPRTKKVVGVLSGTSQNVALAVSAQALADFVTKAQPFMAQTLFPGRQAISPLAADIHPKYGEFVDRGSDGVPRHRPEEPAEVRRLRQSAQLLADNIRDFIAVQSFAWGSGNSEPNVEARYEIRVIGGVQWFRSYPDGEKEFEAGRVPYPQRAAWVLPGDEWSKLPKMIGTEYQLKVHQWPDAVMKNEPIKVFQYYASAEDNLCPFEAVTDFGLFTRSKAVAAACYGEVWTDAEMNIIRISKRLELPKEFGEDVGAVVTYGWLDQANGPRRPVPFTIYVESRQRKHSYWCRGNFTDYRMFSVGARLLQ